ncbi:MAG: hypothetical protein JWP57_3243 [Spirosoma sp.]|nr:hypothetical protein [Spirosoma sp.]
MFGMTDNELETAVTTDFTAEDPALVSQEWPQPKTIQTHLAPVLSLMPDMIPEPLRDWLCDIAHRMKCPLDFVASAAMVMLSALIGTRLTIKPKARDDWNVVPNLWGGVIGGPSAMKTPSVNEVLKPLNRLIAVAMTEYVEAMAEYERNVAEYVAQKKAYESQALDRHKGKNIDTPVSFPNTPEKPKERRYMVNDTTVEKLADLLNDNPTGLLLMRDELVGLLASWEKAGREEDRAFYLEAWNGNNAKAVDRIGRRTTHVKVVCVSLFGGIQPTKLLPYLQAATGYENDGFVQRLQVAVYPDPAPWEYGDDYPDKEARDRAFNLIKFVADTDFKAISYDADDYNKFPYTRFDADAQEIFKQWLIELETKVLPNESGLLLEHFTKYRSLMPSLALVFHVVNCAARDTPAPRGAKKLLVSVDAVKMAVRWCDYLQSHARRIYGLLDSMPAVGAKELLSHLKKGDLPDRFKVWELRRKGWSYLTSAEQIESALAVLTDHNWLRQEQPTAPFTGRTPDPIYRIHPTILPKP